MPKTIPSAMVDTSAETADVYKWALGEYKTDRFGKTILDEDDIPTPINPITFPLHNAMVVVNGNRATISVPRDGKANCVIDKLLNVAEPKAATGRRRRGAAQDEPTLTLTGVSERMLKQGIDPEHAVVTFTVTGMNMTERKS